VLHEQTRDGRSIAVSGPVVQDLHVFGRTSDPGSARSRTATRRWPMRPATVAREVRDAIESRYIVGGEPSSALPSERRLAAEFGVARATVRSARAMLRDQQQIRSNVGGPPVVVDPRVTKAPQLPSFTQDALARGWHPSSRLLDAE